MPWVRSKWKQLIALIKKGKVNWLLSYSPDRQARNMMEWGELINCVDEGLIDLKYTNFHFENNASGKMMLGIWFVFSKQYSDKLSEDISRGKKTSVEKGKSQGKYKYGYMRDWNSGYYKPHPQYFSLMRKAFELKIYDNKSDEYIASRLNENGFLRETKKWNKDINPKRLSDVWRDPFYYGIYIYGDSKVNLLEKETLYKPLITEQEYTTLLYRYTDWEHNLSPKEIKAENEEVMPVPRGFIKTMTGTTMAFYITNKHRVNQRLKELQKKERKLELKDIVRSQEIRFRDANTTSKSYRLEITFDIIEKAISTMLDKLKIPEKDYNEYLEYMTNEIDNINEANASKLSTLMLQMHRIKNDKDLYIKQYMGKLTRKDEKEIYTNELNKFDNRIRFLEQEITNINELERDQILELHILTEILQNAGTFYRNASYVQKRKITELLYSNIIVDNKKRLTFEANPWLEFIFWDFKSLSGDKL